ncbi:hypothetical protein BKA63DRAFT_528294 [Paraphoma chrysanthemicola]|nr:hypothetical protein BKA63DRAFT_528294 [Paraphoma chrysanthemicola]
MDAAFDRPADTGYYALRFPWVLRIHEDCTLRDTVSFDELQKLARKSIEVSQVMKSELEDKSREIET